MKKTWNKPRITQLDVSEGTKAHGAGDKKGSRSEGADNGHNRARS